MRLSCFLLTLLLLSGCRLLEKPRAVSIEWNGDKAIGLVIPLTLLRGKSDGELEVRLVKEGERAAMLGDFTKRSDDVLFTPLVPLTLGSRYEVLAGKQKIDEVEIPQTANPAPNLLAFYPSQDTLPENLLKVYLHFSRPMTEGKSMEYITVVRNDLDTLRGTFLDLQPELWNEDGTVLTVWLDPGRIKLDLIPNKELGNPLTKGEKYTISVSDRWKSKDGLPLFDGYKKEFVTGPRDDKSPALAKWSIIVPSSATREPLDISFGESLDHALATHAVHVILKADTLKGAFETLSEETILRFVPSEPWRPGDYELVAEERLEDLSGNNLLRPFERDLKKETPGFVKPLLKKEFIVR